MTKYTILFFSIILSSNAFAVSDQIHSAYNYLNEHEFTHEITNKAKAPKTEIKFNNRYNILKEYQEQNNLPITGKFDEDTLVFVNQIQSVHGYNVTKTLDYNTWFASYNQPDDWKNYIITQSLEKWVEIYQKQKLIYDSSLNIDDELDLDEDELNNNQEVSKNKFIVVNIPSMSLHAYTWDGEDSQEIFNTKVVVGSYYNKTPMDDMHIWGFKYHPNWTPTPNMLNRNVFKQDGVHTDWLRKNGIKAYRNGKEISLSEISPSDKGKVSLIQPPSNNNALGILKFETDSTKNIYLHDTNNKSLFKHNTRAYSAGCVRVEDYNYLATWINDFEDEELSNKLKSKRTRIEKTMEKIPVYYTYTQVMFINNQPVFSPDIYKYNNSTITYE